MSRLGGGIGTRGPGETKLEVDRQHIRRRITKLRRDVKDLRKERDVKRARRQKSNLPQIAIVGYTNAGKSTLMRRLTGADVIVASRKLDKRSDIFQASHAAQNLGSDRDEMGQRDNPSQRKDNPNRPKAGR